MIGRLIFAWIGMICFLAAVTGLFTWSLVIMALLAVALAAIVIFGRQRAARAVNRFVLGPLMRTNNRWLLCLAVMSVFAIVWNFYHAQRGPAPVQSRYEQVYGGNPILVDIKDTQERRVNLFRSGRYSTDAELNRQMPPKPKTAPDWSGWTTRWIATGTLILLTLFYVPFAFRDEATAVVTGVRRRWTERQEVTSDNPIRLFLQRLLVRRNPEAENLPGSPAPSRSPNFGWLRIIGVDLLVETLIAVFTRTFRRG